MKLTDTQLVILSAAAQREDHLLVAPANLKGGAAKAVSRKLLASKLIEELPARHDQPHWRTDEEGRAIGLKLTAAGLAALGIEEEAPPSKRRAPRRTNEAPPAQQPARATGAKGALVISLLQRKKGASIDDLVQATGWLPHTTRAALTGLRKKGYPIDSERENGKRVYRIAEAGEPVQKTSRKKAA